MIAKAAIQLEDEIYTGRIHGQIMEDMARKGIFILEKDYKEGFLDDKGNFLTRTEAFKEASENNQLVPGSKGPRLQSYMLKI